MACSASNIECGERKTSGRTVMVKCKDGGRPGRAEYQVGLPQTDIGSAISPGTEPRLSLSGDLIYIPIQDFCVAQFSLNLYESTHDSQIHTYGYCTKTEAGSEIARNYQFQVSNMIITTWKSATLNQLERAGLEQKGGWGYRWEPP